MDDYLDIFEYKGYFYVAWADAYDGGPGAWLGQEKSAHLTELHAKKARSLEAKDWSEFSYLTLELATREMVESSVFKGDVMTSNSAGYLFEKESDAKKLKAAMNRVLKLAKQEFDGKEVTLPEWAKTALAAGWKMPKGWKP